MPWLWTDDDVSIWYEDSGDPSRPAILLVPGWTFTTAFYRRQVEGLSRDFRVITLDLRGAGRSAKEPTGHSLSQYADDVVALARKLGLEDICIVGWAMGASVAVHAIIAASDLFSSFVWVDHSPRFFSEPSWPYGLGGEMTPRQWDDQIRALTTNRAGATRDLLRSSVEGHLTNRDLDWMVPELLQTPTEVMAQMLATVANVDLRPLLGQLRLPILVVNGRQSIVPCDVGAWLAEQLESGDSVVLEDCGHMPHLEQPTLFNSLVHDMRSSS